MTPQDHAKKVLYKFKIDKAPVDVESIAKKLGAKIVFSAMEDGHCGMIFKDKETYIIGVNSLHPSTRQRFTIAHEIGHLIMHSDLLADSVHVDHAFSERLNRDGRSSLGDDLKEVQANRFAAELLIPSEILKHKTKDIRIDIDDDVMISDLAKKFEVSPQSMSIKILDTFYRNYEQTK